MTLRRLACLLAALTLLPAPALAQRPMTIVDLISVPGREHAAARRPTARRWSTCRPTPTGPSTSASAICGGCAPTAPARRSSPPGKDGESQPRWSPDGKWIAFVGKRDGAETAQVHLLPLEGGEARALTTHATAASSPAWSPDGRYVYFMADDAKSAEQLAREKTKDDVYAFDENMPMRHLWRIEVASRAETRVTSGDVLDPELRAVDRRPSHGPSPGPEHGARRRRPRRDLGDGRRRRQRRRRHQEHRGRKQRQPVARRRANPVPVGLERAARDLLQRQPVRDALGRRAAARPHPRLRQRDHRRRLVQGRPQHLRHRQHGGAQPALRDPSRRAGRRRR